MNKTKVVATIGPMSLNKETLKRMIEAGVDVFRINLKHATREFCIKAKEMIDKVNKELKTNVALMFDTKGPQVKVGLFSGGEATYEANDKIRIYMDDIIGDSTKFCVDYKDFLDEVNYDTIIKIHDSNVELQVLDKGKDYLLCLVLHGGVIKNNQSLTAVGVNLNLPCISNEDKDDILFAHDLNIDFVCLSNVSSGEDILDGNDLLIELGNNHMGIIAKIENERAVNDIDNIINNSDGILIARVDLGIELPIERIPGIQKSIINKCHQNGKFSIVAVDMVIQDEEDDEPTRAEVSDVANAVLDGVDAIMLTGKTAKGIYPVETIFTINKILDEAETEVDYYSFMDKALRTENRDISGVIAHNVASSAMHLNCKAIYAPTISGYTARKISRFRPICPIIAASPNVETVKSLQLYFAVCPVLIHELHTFDKVIEAAKKMSQDVLDLNLNDKYIITGGYPFKDVKHTNFMKIEEL